MIRKTRYILPFILLITSLACSKAPPQASDIAGMWQIEESGMSGTLTLRPDATYTADTDAGRLSGTWKIEGERLAGTVSQSTVSPIRAGYSWASVISDWSKTELELTNRSGETERYRRVK